MFKSVITPEMHYDDWADRYDSDVMGWGYRAPGRVLAAIKPFLKAHPQPLRMLDVGIGTGILSRKCRALREDMVIAGLDVSSRMLDLCAETGVADELYRLDAARERFPFGAGAFDVTAAAGLMENIGNIGHAVAEMARVTRPGGLIAFTYMPTTRHPQRERLAQKLRPGRTGDGHFVIGDLTLFRHNPDVVRTLARTAGIEPLAGGSFAGYRTNVIMTVRYDLFVGRKVRGLQ